MLLAKAVSLLAAEGVVCPPYRTSKILQLVFAPGQTAGCRRSNDLAWTTVLSCSLSHPRTAFHSLRAHPRNGALADGRRRTWTC